jgi:hypothetical protein
MKEDLIIKLSQDITIVMILSLVLGLVIGWYLTMHYYKSHNDETKINDRYYKGLGEGEATAYTLISEIIEEQQYKAADGVLVAIKKICEYELLNNPYRSTIHVFKTKAKEI